MIVRKEGGDAAEMFGTSLDITDRRSLEHQLAHAQKMEVLGQLTSGIAHDFNNMLTVIFNGLDRLQQAVETGSPMARYADMAMRGALSCAYLTRHLLGFARRHPLQPKPLNLNAEIARLWDLLGRMLEANMQVRQRCAAGLWTVIADPLQIEAALMNLIVNARDAMPDNGAVTVSTRNRVDDDRAVLDVAVGLLEGLGYAVVDAEDGPSALALIESDPEISLLFTDWAMPYMDGRELAAKAALLRPDLPVLFTSGNADLFFSGVPAATDVMFVAKPYRKHDLDAAVRTVLAASQNS